MRNKLSSLTALLTTALQQDFVPTLLPGLRVWVTAKDINNNGQQPADGSALATWVNKTGLGNLTQGTGAKQPTYKTAIVNGRAGVRFNGSTTVLNGTFSDITTLHTGFVVRRLNSINSHSVWYKGNSSTSGFGFFETSTRNVLFGGRAIKVNGTSTVNTTDIITLQWNGTTSTIRVNGIAQTLTGAATTPNSAVSTFFLGASTNLVEFLDGDIAEFILTNTVLSAKNINMVEQYLATQWKVAVA